MSSRDSPARLIPFLAVAALLWLGHAATGKPIALLVFKCYLGALAALLVYRMLASLPGLNRVIRPTRITAEGVYALLLALVFAFAAIYTGDNLMHLITALMLALFSVSGALSGASLAGLAVVRRLDPVYFAGVPGSITIECRNPRWLWPSVSVGVEDRAAGPGGAVYFPTVPARGSRTQRYAWVPPRRGELALDELRLASRFPFGLFERDRLLVRRDTALVLPRVSPVRRRWDEGRSLSAAQPSRSRQAWDEGEDLVGLREYRLGDRLQRIAWRPSARRGQLLVREHAPPADRRVVLAVDSRVDPRDSTRSERVESVLRISASLLVHLMREGYALTLLLPGRPLLAHGNPYTLLAALGREDNTTHDLAGDLARRRLPGGQLVLVWQDPATAAPSGRFTVSLHAGEEQALLDTRYALRPDTAERIRLP